MYKVYITNKSFAIICKDWRYAEVCILPLENVDRQSHDFLFISTAKNLSVRIYLSGKIEQVYYRE